MSKYDPETIQRFADKLYARASATIGVSTFLGVVIGFVASPFVLQSLPTTLAVAIPAWVSPIVFGLLGMLQGLERAFLLKIQAQTALCQLQIERNTRPDRHG